MGLRFKANQASAKAVLLALEQVHQVLRSLGDEDVLDEKLAEYAFFPFTHIFNQSRRVSSHGLEVAVRCVEILVTKGWRAALLPEMARQLLILMGLLVSQTPQHQSEPATDELKVASFECMVVLVRQSASLGSTVLAESGDRNIVDQLVYQLLEAITETSSDHVQISATYALLELNHAVRNSALLASLLPRTVSTLVKVLRPSTQARRTRQVLVAYLELLKVVLRKVLADQVVSQALAQGARPETMDTHDLNQGNILDKSWLDATTPQIDLALIQVVKLRTHEGSDVAEAILDLCLMVVEECSQTLARSLPLMVETLVVLSRASGSSKASAALRHVTISFPEVTDILNAKFYEWSQALPRIMQGSDDRPKQYMLGQVATSFAALTDALAIPDELVSRVASILVASVSASIESSSGKSELITEAPRISPNDLVHQSTKMIPDFAPVLLNHQSQQFSTAELTNWVRSLKSGAFNQNIASSLIGFVRDPDQYKRLSAIWLALQFLQPEGNTFFDIAELIDNHSPTSDFSLSRPFLVSDLYSLAIPYLSQHADGLLDHGPDWRLVALSLECLVLQASQLGQSYRPELMETLFPLLTLLGSPNAILQRHGMTALNALAAACEYASASQMLVENVDYLVNAIALRLNSFDVSQDGLQVLGMMIRLCGATLLSHLDDLIGSIFGALDNFHGYPILVEHLFEVLRMVVVESARNPTLLAIEPTQDREKHQSSNIHVSGIEKILHDLRTRKERKSRSGDEDEEFTGAPHRPWTKSMEGSTTKTQSESLDDEENDEGDRRLEHAGREKGLAISKSHQLLLDIAQSTVPHMTSPSPRVRLTLLELLQDICPILARNENSFLPLVNSIWPVIIPRVLARMDDASPDLAYNVRAAADTISIICRAAGDFMASRINELFSDLESLFKKIHLAVESSKRRQAQSKIPNGTQADSLILTDRQAVRGQSDRAPDALSAQLPYPELQRTSDAQILEALIALFVSILESVRISEDNADRAFDMLSPFAHKDPVREALRRYNEDALWLIEQHERG